MQPGLMTFLGSVPASRGGNYETSTYDFSGRCREARFFGTALADEIRPGWLRVLGTAGSMWDVLAHEMNEAVIDTPLWEELEAAVRHNAVTQELLDAMVPLLGHPDRKLDLRLIPYGYDPAAQIDILRALSAGLGAGERVVMDVTHGLRHLPMLGLLSALYLQAVRKAEVVDIYYAAYDRRDGKNVTPVVRLGGLLDLYHWIRALECFNKDGDYGVFSPLLNREGLRGDLLAEAAFLERIANSSLAKQKLDSFDRQASQAASPAGELFLPELRTRIEWRRKATRHQREAALAREYLARRDFIRATQFGYESLVSEEVCRRGGDANDFDSLREEADDYLAKAARDRRLDVKSPENFITLKNLRNSLAHGIRSKLDAQSPTARRSAEFIAFLTQDANRLHDWLTQAFKHLPR